MFNLAQKQQSPKDAEYEEDYLGKLLQRPVQLADLEVTKESAKAEPQRVLVCAACGEANCPWVRKGYGVYVTLG